MSVRSLATCAALAVACLVPGAARADPIDIPFGTARSVEVPGVDFGGKLPKVKARFVGAVEKKRKGKPKLKLIVRLNGASTLTLSIKKVKGSGVFDVDVTPKGGETVVIGQVTVEPARLTEVEGSEFVVPGSRLNLRGAWLSPKAGRVFVNGKKAKVLTWRDTFIQVLVHKKTPPGLADVRVIASTGTAVLEDAVTVTEPPASVKGPERMTAVVDGERYKANEREAFGGGLAGNGRISAVSQEVTGDPERPVPGYFERSIVIVMPFDPDTYRLHDPIPLEGGSAPIDLRYTFISSVGDPVVDTTETYRLGVGNDTHATVTITAYDTEKKKFVGTFEGRLRLDGTGRAIEITNGEFLIDFN